MISKIQSNKNLQHWLIASLVALVISWLALQNIEYHAVWSFTDDTSIAYSHAYKYPERFENDIFSVIALGSLNGSLVNWGSAILWKHFDISPFLTYGLFAYLQSITLGLSIYWLTWLMTKRFGISLVAMLVAYAIRPYHWNLGSYNDLYPFVYVAQFSLFLVLISLGAALTNRRPMTIAGLVLAGIIHPMMGTYGFAIVGLYWLLCALQQRDFKSLRWMIALILFFIVMLIPTLQAAGGFQGTVPSELTRITLLENGHLNPYPSPDPLLRFITDPQAVSFLSWVSYALLAFLVLPWKKNPATKTLSISLVIAGAFLIISQWIGLAWEINALILASGGRVSYIIAMWVIPLCITLLFHYIQTRNTLAILILASSITVIAYSRNVLFMGVHLILLILLELLKRQDANIREKLDDNFIPIARGFIAIAFIVSLFFFTGILDFPKGVVNIYARYLIDSLNEISASVKVWHFLAIGIAVTILENWPLNSRLWTKFPKISNTALGITFLGLTLIGATSSSINKSKELFQNEWVKEVKQLQDWAIDNSSQDAHFMGVVPGWRSRTIRPYLYFIPRSWYIYILDERLLEWQVQHLEWLGHENYPPHPTYGIAATDGYYKLNSQSVLGLRDKEGIDYAIWSTAAQSLDFKIEFQTQNYIIYNLHEPVSTLLTGADRNAGSDLGADFLPPGGFIFDARHDAGFNSLRANIVLGYVPALQMTPGTTNCYQNGYRETILQNTIPQSEQMQYLRIEYIYIDKIGWSQLSVESQEALTNSDQYEEILSVNHNDESRTLFRLIDFQAPNALPGETTLCEIP